MPRKKRDYSPLPGFPKHFTFECREAVDAYLSGDRITCLLCGHDFRALEAHLKHSHEMTNDDYREKYGLPYRRGLCSGSVSERMSEVTKQRFQDNKEFYLATLEKAKAVQAENGNPQRNKPVFWKKERTRYEHEAYEEFIRRVCSGRGVFEVGLDPDMPHCAHVYTYMKKNKEFEAKYRAIIPLFAPIGRRKSAGARG